MEEPISTSKDEPKPEETASDQKQKTECVIHGDSPTTVIVRKEGTNWGSVVEWVLVSITLALAYFTWKTAQYASNQAKAAIEADSLTRDAFIYQAKKDSIDSTAQARKDAFFALYQKARDSLSLESFILENRAYLNFKEISELQLPIGKPMSFSWGMINTGKTPAYRVRQITRWQPNADYADKEFNSTRASVDTGLVIGSGLPYIHICPNIVVEDSLTRSKLRETPIYIAIVVEYEDFFHRQRRTRAHLLFVNDSTFYLRKFNDAN
ncbi:MAG: hypothetical protein WBW16_10220 [Bacteroidota bacterium]